MSDLTGAASVSLAEDWHYVGDTGEPAFGAGWTNTGGGTSATAYRISAPGVAHLYIGATVGSAAEVFTLPAGYRPSADTLAVGSGYTFGGSTTTIAVTVMSDGTVQPIMPASSTVAVFAGFFWLASPNVVA